MSVMQEEDVRSLIGLWDSEAATKQFLREAVKSAADLVTSEAARSWLQEDERGAWERAARSLLDSTPKYIADKVNVGDWPRQRVGPGLCAFIHNEMAVALAMKAVDTMLVVSQKGGKRE